MSVKPIPFWQENDADSIGQQRCVSMVFALLEHKIGCQNSTIQMARDCFFAFAPDPPLPATLFAQQASGVTQAKTGQIRWGHAGNAFVTDDMATAITLAPMMLRLRADTLFVVAFATQLPDDDTLHQWITATIDSTTGAQMNVHQTTQHPLPLHAVLIFDWGDLVATSPAERAQYQQIMAGC